MTALSALRMKRLSVVAPALSHYFHEWLSTPHRLLSFLMVGNNLVNFGFSSLAAILVVPLHGVLSPNAAGVLVWLAVTAVILVFGEIIPKIIGRVYRERVAEWTLPALSRLTRSLFWLWGPVGWAIERWAPALHRAPVNLLTVVSLEELHHAVGESQASGQMSGESGDMFRRALALAQKPVVEVAQPPERLDTLALEVLSRPGGRDLFLDLLVETGRTRVPVTRGGKTVGYVNVLELLQSVRSGGGPNVEALVRPLRKIAPDMKAIEILETFRRTGEAVAWVEGPDGVARGLLTLEDVLEEVVGEILDEYDLERAGGTE